MQHGDGPDLLLRTVAWLGIVAIVWRLPVPRLWLALGTTFGLGWVAWLGYVLSPGWPSWGVYQGVRAVGIGLFCWAAVGQPTLRVVQ